MKCPHCGNTDDKVIQSRSNSVGTSIKRRRECCSCGYRFTSYEQIEEKPLMIVKRDNSRQQFNREKLASGIRVSIRKRTFSETEFEEMLNCIEDKAEMEARDSGEISSVRIGEMVLDKLYELDKVAYIRFASVYRMYKDVDEFIKEIEILTEKKEK